MSDSVDRVFFHALNTVKRIPRTGTARPPASERLKLYGLYKQSTEGDVEGVMDRPVGNTPDVYMECEKWDAWFAQRGISRTEAKRRYISTLIETMHEYASQTAEARELVAELEFVWDQVKSNMSSSSASALSPVHSQSTRGSIGGQMTQHLYPEHQQEQHTGSTGPPGDSRLRVLSPVSQPDEIYKRRATRMDYEREREHEREREREFPRNDDGDDNLGGGHEDGEEQEEAEEEEDEEYAEAQANLYEDDDDDDGNNDFDQNEDEEEEGEDTYNTHDVGTVNHDDNDQGYNNTNHIPNGSRKRNRSNHYGNDLHHHHPNPEEEEEEEALPKTYYGGMLMQQNKDNVDSRRWRRRVEQALTKMTAEIAAAREQMEARALAHRRRSGVWAWLRWLVWVTLRQIIWDLAVLGMLLIWMRLRRDPRLEEKLRSGWSIVKTRLLSLKALQRVRRVYISP